MAGLGIMEVIAIAAVGTVEENKGTTVGIVSGFLLLPSGVLVTGTARTLGFLLAAIGTMRLVESRTFLKGLELGWRRTTRVRWRRSRVGTGVSAFTFATALLTTGVALCLFQRLLGEKMGSRLEDGSVLSFLNKFGVKVRVEQQFLPQVKMTLRASDDVLVVQNALSGFETKIAGKIPPFLSV